MLSVALAEGIQSPVAMHVIADEAAARAKTRHTVSHSYSRFRSLRRLSSTKRSTVPGARTSARSLCQLRAAQICPACSQLLADCATGFLSSPCYMSRARSMRLRWPIPFSLESLALGLEGLFDLSPENPETDHYGTGPRQAGTALAPRRVGGRVSRRGPRSDEAPRVPAASASSSLLRFTG